MTIIPAVEGSAIGGWKIPLFAEDPPSASPFPSGEANRKAAPAVLTILLVEDNRSDVFIIKEILKRDRLEAGLHVVNDGAQAINFWDRIENDSEASCVDLVLLDLNIPKISGIEVLRRIRSGTRCADVPVVVVTSSRSPADLEAIEALKASAYFQKPNDLSAYMELGTVIRKLIGA